MQRAGCSKLALGSPLLSARQAAGAGLPLGTGCSCPSLASCRRAGGLPLMASLHPPWAQSLTSFLFHWREMRNICIFQPCKPKISGFSPSLSVPGCGRANSHWRPPADGSAAYPLARAVVTKDKGMYRFQFWRPEAGPPGASRLALCRKDAPRPPARAGRWLPPSVPACGFV